MSQKKRPEVIYLHGDVKSIVGVFIPGRSDPRIIYQDVQSGFVGIDVFGKLADGLE